MSTYEEMTRDELLTLKDALQKEYDEYCALDLSLNMAPSRQARERPVGSEHAHARYHFFDHRMC